MILRTFIFPSPDTRELAAIEERDSFPLNDSFFFAKKWTELTVVCQNGGESNIV